MKKQLEDDEIASLLAETALAIDDFDPILDSVKRELGTAIEDDWVREFVADSEPAFTHTL